MPVDSFESCPRGMSAQVGIGRKGMPDQFCWSAVLDFLPGVRDHQEEYNF